jgi:hypothetical protein
MIGTGVAVFAFYFIFLRGGRGPAAEASVPPASAPTTVAGPAATEPEPPSTARRPEPAVVELPKIAEPAAPKPEPAPAKHEWQQDVAIDKMIEDGKPYEARAEIARLFASAEISDTMRAELATKAFALNQRLLVAQADPRDIDVSEIQQGENLITFSRRFKQLHGEYGIVKLVNNIKNDGAIRAGQKLRVPKGAWSILVDKSLFTLYLCYQGAPFKSYRVCVGAKDNTPSAAWTVGIKNPKPEWTAPQEWLEREKEKNPIRYGNPKNPLGEYWIGIDNPSFSGFGIHGTNQPETIGTKASMGCVRMLNADVVELARIAHKGMEVVTLE